MADQQTHFGFKAVAEREKAKKSAKFFIQSRANTTS